MTNSVTVSDLIAAIRRRDREHINGAAAQLLDQRASLGDQWTDVAHVLIGNGEIALALNAARLGVEGSRGSTKSLFGLAQVTAAAGHQREAMQIVSAMTPAQLAPAQRDHFLGTCALETGDLDLARDALERVVAFAPAAAPSWLSLSALPAADDEVLLSRLDAVSGAIAATPADNRAQWHYAKGAVLDRVGRHDEAFGQFSEGARIRRSLDAFDRDADRSQAETLIGEFTAASIEKVGRQVSVETGRPIFVTGLPRSGTSLIEHILAAHSAVAGGGEVPFASILAREIGGNSLTKLTEFAAARSADELARLYLHVGEERFGAGSRFVDKWLGNTRTLGLIASVLPQARIIWLRRNPVDCAWSCFKTYFSQRIDWSWSLEDIAAHFQAEDHLYEHWERVLGERLLTVSYEELVADPEAQIDRILTHVGLELEPGLADAHRTTRAVTTASLAQVREPIYRRAVGSAEPYRAWLTPFIHAYGETGSAA